MDDAEPAPLTTARLSEPRHPLVWIRLSGRWVEGEVEAWYRADVGRGAWCVMVRTGRGVARPYRYDPATIVERREGEAGPGGA